MTWLDTLERRYRHLAIPGLVRQVCMIMIVTFALDKAGVLPSRHLVLYTPAVLNGEIWRLVTFLFVPVSDNPFLLLLQMMIMVLTGDGLESAWGSFRLTVYYIVGALATALIAVLLPNALIDNTFLNLSLFFAFATVYPDYEILLFFILPVKVKWLAWLSAFWVIFAIITEPWVLKVVALLSVANYLLFFWREFYDSWRLGAATHERRRRMEAAYDAAKPSSGARHVCAACGANEQTHPRLLFRYCTCAACGADGRAFCPEHLKAHKEQGTAGTGAAAETTTPPPAAREAGTNSAIAPTPSEGDAT